MVPTGQIHPQKNLPRKRVATTRRTAGRNVKEREWVTKKVITMTRGEDLTNRLVWVKVRGYAVS